MHETEEECLASSFYCTLYNRKFFGILKTEKKQSSQVDENQFSSHTEMDNKSAVCLANDGKENI